MITGICCTHGRFRCLQRALQCYIDQTYQGESAMFICNSGEPLKLPDDFKLPENKHVYIDNCKLMNFQTVGEKYTHALQMCMRIFPETSVIFSEDDDDIFLPNHLLEGHFGTMSAGIQFKKAYKPKQSWFRYRDRDGILQISKQENTLEPSIFVNVDWLLKYGYAPVSVKYHQQWLDPLIEQNKIFIYPDGKSTLIYNWGDNTNGPDSWGIYKMSGSGNDNQQNFIAHSRTSTDMGNGILTPSGDNSSYYKLT